MKIKTLAGLDHIVGDMDIPFSDELLKAVLAQSVNNARDPWSFRNIKPLLEELSSVDSVLRDELSRQLTEKKTEADKREQAELAAQKAEQEAKSAARRSQIFKAIDEAAKQGLNPLALIPCSADCSCTPIFGGKCDDGCPEPCTTLLLRHQPESNIVNLDHAVDAACRKHWRQSQCHPLFWHNLSFLHPLVSTICIDSATMLKAWSRHPEKFGKPIPTAEDCVGSTIQENSWVVYQRPAGHPQKIKTTETTFAQVVKLFRVGREGSTIDVLQVRRAIENLNDPKDFRMSTRLSTKYADKVVVLSEVPKKFRRMS